MLHDRPSIYLSPPHLCGEEMKMVAEALKSNWIAPLGPMVDAFEREFAGEVEATHALAVSSGTAALHLGMRCLGVRPGDIVISPSLTFIATVAPAVQLGAEPFFVDVQSSSWTLDPNLVEDALKQCQKNGRRVGLVVAVDLYGCPCDLDAVVTIAGRYGVPVLADCAESLGAKYQGRCVGTGSSAAAFSFNGNKIITTSGGGMLVTEDPDLVDRARFLSQQARDPASHYQHSEIGYNYRMSNILAAIGRAQLKVLESRVNKRREIFASYKRHLEDLDGLWFVPEPPFGKSTNWLTVIQISGVGARPNRDAVRLDLLHNRIEARPVWKPLHTQPVFSGAQYVGGHNSEELFETGLCLPSGSQMTDDDVRKVSDVVRKCFG